MKKTTKSSAAKISTRTSKKLTLDVKVLQCDIDNAVCRDPSKCMEKVGIARALDKIDPGVDHKVRIEAGVVKFKLWGWRWQGWTPQKARMNLLQFDSEEAVRLRAERAGTTFVSKVIEPHDYRLVVERTTKIEPRKPFTAEELARHRKNRKIREEKTGVSDTVRYSKWRKRFLGMTAST